MPFSSKDLEAYLKLRRLNGPITIRGFQRLMGYSSPGKAERVLKRLERFGLVERARSSEYVAKKDLPPELASYVIIKGIIVPRTLVYAVYATTAVMIYTLLAEPSAPLMVFLTALVIPYWLESLYSLTLLKRIRKQEH
ncbi:MAG: hypothetical protein QXP89_01025 [Desulfurococcaceae archaeon]